jgi:hypothetical protein
MEQGTMNANQVKQMFAAMDKAEDQREGYNMDAEWEETNGYTPAPGYEPASYIDLDAPDYELHGTVIPNATVALNALRKGHTLIAQCGPLQVQASASETDYSPSIHSHDLLIWNTVTTFDITHHCRSLANLVSEMLVFGYFADGAWTIYAPDEGDDSPQY